jgi:hypothetical protein
LSAPPPITSAEVPDEWIAACREAMSQREGVPIRAHPTLPRIQAYQINSKQWGDIILYGSGRDFVSAEERDAVMRRLGEK